MKVYHVLRQAQGSAVSEAIDLKKSYFLHGAGAIRHMLLMGWVGESIGSIEHMLLVPINQEELKCEILKSKRKSASSEFLDLRLDSTLWNAELSSDLELYCIMCLHIL